MGLYDHIVIHDARMTCSENHSLSGVELQTKDLGCSYGDAVVQGGSLTFIEGGFGCPPSRPFTGKISAYTTCEQCPAFVQATTANICGAWVEFDLEVVADEVRSIQRTSQDTADWIAAVPGMSYMAGAEGPMPHDSAVDLATSRRAKAWAIGKTR